MIICNPCNHWIFYYEFTSIIHITNSLTTATLYLSPDFLIIHPINDLKNPTSLSLMAL